MVRTEQCGRFTRPYNAQQPVAICYELVDQIEKVAAKGEPAARKSMVAGAFVQVVLHAVAYPVFDLLKVPVWGRTGDAADYFAAMVMLQFGEELALRTIRGTANFFWASRKTWTGSDFADVNSPEEQRFYNYLCIAFGGAPMSFRFLVAGEQPTLPYERAVRCRGEYEQVRQAFYLRVMPHVDPDLLVQVRAMDWLLAGDVR
jgi:hypothetical protein